MNTGKKRKIFLGAAVVLLCLLGMLIWEHQKTKITVLSAVLPKEYQTDNPEWIEGIKVCSKDLGFRVDFFFEEEKDLKERLRKENERKVSSVITKDDYNKESDDPFLEGYNKAKYMAENSNKVIYKQTEKELKVGIAYYNGNDSFIQDMTENIQKELRKLEKEENMRIVIAMEDAAGKQQTQDIQLDYLIDQGCDVIAVNPVDTWSTSKMIHRAKEENIPLIFFNREPSDEDIALWDQVYYVGSDGRNLGQMQGEMLIEAFLKKDLHTDKNNDETLQYILVEGEEGHSDSVRRTDAMHNVVKEELTMEQISSISAGWDRKVAKESFLRMKNETLALCEAVVCNNDDMALGVLDALTEKQIHPLPVIVGINGSKEALQKIKQGSFYGTIFQGNDEQAEKIVGLISQLKEGKSPKGPQKIYIMGEKIKK